MAWRSVPLIAILYHYPVGSLPHRMIVIFSVDPVRNGSAPTKMWGPVPVDELVAVSYFLNKVFTRDTVFYKDVI